MSDIERGEVLSGLMARLAAGDQSALSRLYDLTVDRVYAIAYRVLGSVADAEEAVCDCYQQVWQRAGQYTVDRGSVMAWLSVIGHTRALDIKRKLSDRLRLDPLHPDEHHEAYTQCEDRSLDDLLDVMAVGGSVHAALSDLSAQQRQLIRMAFIDDLSHQEIAERTGIPLGTVKSHIRRGLLRMKEVLGEGPHAKF